MVTHRTSDVRILAGKSSNPISCLSFIYSHSTFYWLITGEGSNRKFVTFSLLTSRCHYCSLPHLGVLFCVLLSALAVTSTQLTGKQILNDINYLLN